MFQDQPAAIADEKRTKLLQLARGWGAYIGSPIDRQSLKFFWLEECLEGENPFVAGTYGKILDAVAGSAKRHAEIHLQCEVVEIGSKGTTENDGVHKQPFVKTADGAVHTFDEVVLTAPLGWLKSNKDVFKPAIPASLSKAIDSISYGHLDKVYLTFQSAWWAHSVSRGISHANTKTDEVSLQIGRPERKDLADQIRALHTLQDLHSGWSPAMPPRRTPNDGYKNVWISLLCHRSPPSLPFSSTFRARKANISQILSILRTVMKIETPS